MQSSVAVALGLSFSGLDSAVAVDAKYQRAACCYLQEACPYGGRGLDAKCSPGTHFQALNHSFDLTKLEVSDVDSATYSVQAMFGVAWQSTFECSCFDWTGGWQCDDPARKPGKPDYGLQCSTTAQLAVRTVNEPVRVGAYADYERAACCYLQEACPYGGDGRGDKCKPGVHFKALNQSFDLIKVDSSDTDHATYAVQAMFGEAWKSSFQCSCFDWVNGWECDDPAREPGKPDYGLQCPRATQPSVRAVKEQNRVGVNANYERAACCHMQKACPYGGRGKGDECKPATHFKALNQSFDLVKVESPDTDVATYTVQAEFGEAWKSTFECNCFDWTHGWQCDDPAREPGEPDLGLLCDSASQVVLV